MKYLGIAWRVELISIILLALVRHLDFQFANFALTLSMRKESLFLEGLFCVSGKPR